jgi:hypothetical protein
MNCFPIVAFDVIENDEADLRLQEWGHWLGACNRPFGRQSFGLFIHNALVAVAVSASTVNGHCAGYKRSEVIELARLCAHPDHRDMTRVAIRLWRSIAPKAWPYWDSIALVSYSNAIRHKGDIYRFDGWTKVASVKGGKCGVNTGWTRPRHNYDPKDVWVWALEQNTQ